MQDMLIQKKTSERKTRLAGTKQEYHTLRLFLNDKEVSFHTSKSANYINRIQKDWK
jgi:hypothetical protein